MNDADIGPIVDIRLIQLPVQMWARSHQHTDELLREFVLMAQTMRQHDARALPVRLVRLVEELNTYSSLSEEQETRLFQAAAAGETALDISYQMPASAGRTARYLGDLLNEADDYCRSGDHLLTLETPPELVRFREWFLEEYRRQSAGEPPTPWPAYGG